MSKRRPLVRKGKLGDPATLMPERGVDVTTVVLDLAEQAKAPTTVGFKSARNKDGLSINHGAFGNHYGRITSTDVRVQRRGWLDARHNVIEELTKVKGKLVRKFTEQDRERSQLIRKGNELDDKDIQVKAGRHPFGLAPGWQLRKAAFSKQR